MAQKKNYNDKYNFDFDFEFWFGCTFGEFVSGFAKFLFMVFIVFVGMLSLAQCSQYLTEFDEKYALHNYHHRYEYQNDPQNYYDGAETVDTIYSDTVSVDQDYPY